MSISVIGGGLTGCLIALELAEAGRKVVLFEKEAELLARASLANEGKIHLGFVYAADTSFRTAQRMIDDALLFRPVLERWIASSDFDHLIYDRFDYLVPNSSMLSVEAIEAHFGQVSQYLQDQIDAGAQPYLGQKDHLFAQRSTSSQDNLQASFTTPERGVWPEAIARKIRNAVSLHPNIVVRTDTPVSRLRSERGAWYVALDQENAREEGPFETVVNCAWAGRRRIDAASGYPDNEDWFYRYKFGVVLQNAKEAFNGEVPRNSTAMLGAYGDSVYSEAEDSLYCSWYPVGMCFSCKDLIKDQPPHIDDRDEAILKTWEGYAGMDPSYMALVEARPLSDAQIVGDYIAAKAQTDIQDPQSKLHERHRIGPTQLAPGYWSVETGKYTSSARCADICSRLILGR